MNVLLATFHCLSNVKKMYIFAVNGVVKDEVFKVSNKEDWQPRKNHKCLLTIGINRRLCITDAI